MSGRYKYWTTFFYLCHSLAIDIWHKFLIESAPHPLLDWCTWALVTVGSKVNILEMGTRESVVEKRPQLQRQSSYDHLIRLSVATCAARIQSAAVIDEFVGYGYRERSASTIQCDFQIHRITVDGERVKLQIMNLYVARYRGLSPVLFRSSLVGLMLLYDVEEERSFERAKELISDAQQVLIRSTLLTECQWLQYWLLLYSVICNNHRQTD